MARLKGVIFGANNVIARDGTADWDAGVLAETGELVRYLGRRGIGAVIVSNHTWACTDDSGRRRNLEDVIREKWGFHIRWLVGGRDIPWKQQAGALEAVRRIMGWE